RSSYVDDGFLPGLLLPPLSPTSSSPALVMGSKQALSKPSVSTAAQHWHATARAPRGDADLSRWGRCPAGRAIGRGAPAPSCVSGAPGQLARVVQAFGMTLPPLHTSSRIAA